MVKRVVFTDATKFTPNWRENMKVWGIEVKILLFLLPST